MSKQKDQISFGPELGDGRRLAVRRQDEKETFGVLAPLKDGEPLAPGAEIVQVETPDHECNGWHDAEVLYRNEGSGPVQVATPAYRDGYDRIFGKKQEVGQA